MLINSKTERYQRNRILSRNLEYQKKKKNEKRKGKQKQKK